MQALVDGYDNTNEAALVSYDQIDSFDLLQALIAVGDDTEDAPPGDGKNKAVLKLGRPGAMQFSPNRSF
jgi:hypothetical protein